MQLKQHLLYKYKSSPKAGIILVLLQLLCFTSVKAQQINFQRCKDGPNTTCYSVLEDKKGYIWVSTERGICRYDGSTYKWFDKDMYGNSIYSAFNLMEDSKGRILFNTFNGSLYYIRNDSIFLAQVTKNLRAALVNGQKQIVDMYEDKDHVLWISTSAGLYRTTTARDYSSVELLPRPPGTDSSHYNLIMLDNKRPIAALYNYLKAPKDKWLRVQLAQGLRKGPVIVKDTVSLYTTYTKTIALKNGIVLWGIENNLMIFYPDGRFARKKMKRPIINLFQDKAGGIWITYWQDGLAYYANDSLNCKPIWSLQGKSISCIIQDFEGGIWATALNDGLYYASTKNVIDYTNVDGLSDEIYATDNLNGKIVVDNAREFETIINRDTTRQLKLPSVNFPQMVYNQLAIGDKIYMAAATGLLETDTSLRTAPSLVISKKATSLGRVYDVTYSKKDKTIYAMHHNCILIINDDTLFRSKVLPSRGQCICATKKGDILWGSTTGLYQYKNNENIYLGTNNNDKFLENSILVIKEDTKGNLWIGTQDKGLGIYKNGKIIITKSITDGLVSNLVKDFAFDSTGNVWVATNKGLSKIYPANNYFIENFNTQNGVISDEINKVTVKGNELWLGTKQGVCVLAISQFGKNKISPPVYISSIKVNDSVTYNKIDFEHNFNNFRFYLSGLTFKDNKSRFLYRLNGLDSSWHSIEFPEVQFNNLGPGKYRFEAKAVNADNVSSLVPAVFSFVIEPPFWLRWWFIVFEVLACGSLIYLFIKSRLKTIQIKEAEKTRINKMLAEYQMTALSAQMNPHFVFNAINSIQDYILGNNTQKAYDYLTKFARLVRMILENAKERTITLEKEMELLKMYMALEQLRFENKFEIIINISDEVDTYGILIPSMIMQPYVENAIWHGLMPLGNSRKGVLKINLAQKEDLLLISIEDNGIGRSASREIRKSTSHKSVGMEITKDRLDVLNSIMQSNNSEINILDLYDNETKPIGTRVEIKITTNSE